MWDQVSWTAETAPTIRPVPGARRPPVRGFMLGEMILIDTGITWMAFCGAYFLCYVVRWVPRERDTLPVTLAAWMPFGIVFLVLTISSKAATGLYRRSLGRDPLDGMVCIVRAATIAVGLVVIVTVLLPVGQYSSLVVVYSWLLLIPGLIIGRMAFLAVLERLYRSGRNGQRVLIAGSTPLSRMVLQRLAARKGHGY